MIKKIKKTKGIKKIKKKDIRNASTYIRKALECLGINFDSADDYLNQHIKDTPHRIARTWAEFVQNLFLRFDRLEDLIVTFDNNVSEMIVVRDIPFNSLCIHHFFPFSGVAHIAYFPKEKIIGLSKIPRIVRLFAKSPTIQEELTDDIARFLFSILDPQFVMVLMEAKHTCCACRGVESANPMITTSIYFSSELTPEEMDSFKEEAYQMLSFTGKSRLPIGV